MTNKFTKIEIDSRITNRVFTYTKNDVRLSFTLRTDVKQELKDFLELLEIATKEVREEINKK